MKNINNLLLLLVLVLAFSSVKAQDRMPDAVNMQRKPVATTAVAPRNMLLKEAYVLPAAHLYSEWKNSGVHYTTTLPDSFLIDLRGYVMPTTNTKITDIFGYRPRRRRVHNGLDIKVQRGDTIYAAFDGKVRITAYQRRGYGHYILIRHNNGIETLYAHLTKKLVTVNQDVKAGDPIGLGGNTGRSSGAHLHFETLLLGKALNPALFFDFKNQKTTSDTYLYRRPGSKYIENGKVKVAGPEPKYHKVKSGETIGKIARKYGVSQATIFKLNKLSPSSVIRVGQTIRYQ